MCRLLPLSSTDRPYLGDWRNPFASDWAGHPATADTNPPTKLRNSVAIHCISREIKIAVSITDWYEAALGKPGVLREPELNATWRGVLRELGWNGPGKRTSPTTD
jgi:hypothetical protein